MLNDKERHPEWEWSRRGTAMSASALHLSYSYASRRSRLTRARSHATTSKDPVSVKTDNRVRFRRAIMPSH